MSKTNTKLDSSWFAHIGAKGGKATNPDKGFGTNRSLASLAGKLGMAVRKLKNDKLTDEERAAAKKSLDEIAESLNKTKS